MTSLKTGFEELEMELKDLIDHSTKDVLILMINLVEWVTSDWKKKNIKH